MRSTTEVLADLAGKWSNLTDEEQRNTSTKVAGIYQLSRFNALMLNWDMGIEATTSSIDSQNSAMREQEEYSKSLEARLNRLRTEWISFANTAGEAIIYDSLVVGTSLLKGMTSGVNGLVGEFGALAPMFGIAATAAVFLSKSLFGVVTAQVAAARATVATSGATGVLAGAMTAGTAAVNLMGLALKRLLLASGVGVAFVALGFALEKIIGVWSDSIQASEDFDNYVRKNTEALTTNKVAVEELISQYNALSSAKENGHWDSTKEEEYLKVQQTLSEMFPALIDHIDASGQAHLKTTAEINKEIAATEKLSKAQDQLTVDKAGSTIGKMMDGIVGDWNDSLSNFLNGSLQSQLKNKTDVLASALKNGASREAISELEYDIANLEKQIADSMAVITGEVLKAVEALHRLNGTTIDSELAKSTEAFLRSLDLSDLDEGQFNKLVKDFADAQEALQKAVETGNKVNYDKAVQSLNDLAKASGSGEFKGFTVDFEKMTKAVKEGVVIHMEGEVAAEGHADALGGLASQIYELKDATEQMAGVSQQQIKDTADLLWQYEMLTVQMQGYTEAQIEAMIKSGNLTSEEMALVSAMEDRKAIMMQIDSIYPSLLDKDGKAIKLTEEKIAKVKEEQRANEVLLKAYKLSRDGKLTAEQQATLAQAQGTKKRIDNIKIEIEALNILQKALQETYNKQAELANQKIDTSNMTEEQARIAEYTRGYGAYQSGRILGQTDSKISSYTSELDALQGQLNTNIGKIDSFSTAIENSSKSTGKSTSAKEKDNKETEKSIYLADQYKRKLEELNLAIQKEIALREKISPHNQAFTSSLQTQLNLENAKLEAMKAQEKSIDAQVKAGKVQTTGVVKQSEAVKTMVQETKKLSGFQGKITSKFGERADKHRGTDIAGKAGTGIDSFAGGKVIAAGYGGKAGAEKMHSSYGNVVVVQSDDGTKRLYAHMEKVLVKVGQQIEAGSRIGTIGTTGTSSGNHLHYELTQNGKLVDSYNEVMKARQGVLTTTVTGGGNTAGAEVANVQQTIDQAKSDLIGIQNDILAQEQAITELQKNMVDAVVSGFEFKKSNYDKFLENGENRLAKLNKTSKEYRSELEKQAQALNSKKSINQAEMNYLNEMIKSGTLNEKLMSEYTETLHELGKVNSEIDFSLKDLEESKLQSYIDLVEESADKYAKLRQTIDGTLDYENVAINDLDTNSVKYTQTLERINSLMKDKNNLNKQELDGLNKLIKNGGLYDEALENAKIRVQELTTEIKQLQLDIKEGNFNILINIKTQSDEVIDDIQFEIDRAEALRKMYEEGSANHKGYTEEIIKQYQLMAQKHLDTRNALQAELKLQDITATRRKEILELLEDEHLAYLNATLAIKDYNKQLEEANKSRLEQIANDVISALKAAYQERRDEHMKLIDEELKREQKAHEARVKQLNDEMDLFRKNVEEKLRLIDRQEAERGYNMEIEEMQKERDKVQREINKLAMDDSYEAKKKRKQLQEQLDKIDKDIAEKRHQRDIELQKQGLNDLLESKENEVDEKLELEDKEYQGVVDRINREKEYWEKYYTDLLNDERKFAQIREDILAGHFDKVRDELAKHIEDLKATMPALLDTMDGTMEAVGDSIRLNVIDQLQAAIDKIGEFNATQVEDKNGFTDNGWTPPNMEDFNKPDSGNSNSNANSGNSGSSGDSSNSAGFGLNSPISQGDIEVLAGKYLNEMLQGQTKDTSERKAIKAKGDALAAQGRASGSKIVKDIGFNSIAPTLKGSDKAKLRGFMNIQAMSLGNDNLMSIMKRDVASLDTGGMTSFTGGSTGGIDGKNAKLAFLHDSEVIQNPLDTSRMLKTAELSNSLLSKLSSLVNPLLQLPTFQANAGVGEGNVTITFGDIYNSSQDSAKSFARTIINDIKRTRG